MVICCVGIVVVRLVGCDVVIVVFVYWIDAVGNVAGVGTTVTGGVVFIIVCRCYMHGNVSIFSVRAVGTDVQILLVRGCITWFHSIVVAYVVYVDSNVGACSVDDDDIVGVDVWYGVAVCKHNGVGVVHSVGGDVYAGVDGVIINV